MALKKDKNGAPIINLDPIKPTAVEEALSFEVSANLVRPLAASIPPSAFSEVCMRVQQAFYMGMALERRGMSKEEVKQLEEFFHDFTEHIKKCKDEADKEYPQYGNGEA